MSRRLWLGFMTGVLLGAPVVLSAPSVSAQQVMAQAPYRILDPDRLLQGSVLGQQILAANRAAEQALETENAAVAEQLIAEERALTELRASLSPEEFRTRADAFDARVEEIRTDRNQRSEVLARQLDAEVQRFFNLALPVLDRLMADVGAVGLIRPEMMVLWSEGLDVTDLAIARLDAAFAEQATPPAPEPGAAPETAPQQQP